MCQRRDYRIMEYKVSLLIASWRQSDRKGAGSGESQPSLLRRMLLFDASPQMHMLGLPCDWI